MVGSVGQNIESYANFNQTFANRWSASGIDFNEWGTDYFWDRSFIINDERQYYPSRDEVQQYAGQGVTAPWRVASNGNLILEIKPVPDALKTTRAFMGNVNDYSVISGAAGSRSLTLDLGGDFSRGTGLMGRGGWVGVWHANATARKQYRFTSFTTSGTRVTLALVSNLDPNVVINNNDKKAQVAVQQEFISGLLTTRAPGQFGQVRGRFEIRCKFPRGQQLFPAFWLLGKRVTSGTDPYPHSTEFDVVENYGHDPSLVFFTYHSPNKQNNPNGPAGQKNMLQVRYDTTVNPPTIDFSAGFHTYSLDWTQDGYLVWGLDGKIVAVQPLAGIDGANIDKNSLDIEREKFLLVNLAFGSGDSRAQIERDRPNRGPGIPATFPSQFEIEYIKAYQYKSGGGGGGTPPSSGTSITVTTPGTNRVIAGTTSDNLKGRGLYVDMKNGNGYSVTVSATGTWSLTVPSSNDGQDGKQVSVYGQAADGTTDTKLFTYSIGGGGGSGNSLNVIGTGRTVSGNASSNFVGRDVYIDMKNGRGYSARVQSNGTWSYAIPSSEDSQRGVQVSAYVQAASGESLSKTFTYTTN